MFSELSHSDLLDLIVRKLRNLNLKNIHNFRDEASIDLILNEKGYKIGIQVEVNNDIKETTKNIHLLNQSNLRFKTLEEFLDWINILFFYVSI